MFWNLSCGLMLCNSKRGECKQHNYHFYLHFHMQLHLYLYLCFISKRRGNASKTICIYICICIGICIFICFAFLKEGGMQVKQFAPARITHNKVHSIYLKGCCSRGIATSAEGQNMLMITPTHNSCRTIPIKTREIDYHT